MKIAFIDLLGLTYDGDTLNKRGLGGSESAVILLSKELSLLGYDVTVYNNCIDSEATPGVYNGVTYIDHSSGPQDTQYDIVVCSRSVMPIFSNNQYAKICHDAKKTILWMHDTFCEGDQHIESMLLNGYIDEVFTLSDFHSWYFTTADHGSKRNFEVLKHKFWQTRNGAVRHINDVDLSKKDQNHFVYNASATKGLIPLVTKIWPQILQSIPNAHLTCIGGYYRFREGAEPDAQEKTVQQLVDSKPPGVTFTGVISQQRIAEILANANMMLYPTAFPETFGISSLESLLYKTPIVTNVFGALEETAVDIACYKIPYSSTNNALFNNIDESAQAEKFVQTVLDAYNNTYLHYQKQNYCEVVNDIHSWGTVALQWDQHFHSIMDLAYPVDKYRAVTRINKKVARVFGRRFNNIEQRKEYSSTGDQRRIVVISPFRNADAYIKKHIDSVAQQDYDNYLHILIDDNSDNILSYSGRNNKIIRNSEHKGCVQNQLTAINEFVKEDDIVMLLDGDDWLVNNNTLFHLYNDLYQQGYDFTYGSMWSVADNIPLIAQDWNENGSYPWKIPYTHLRTMSGEIALKLNWDNYNVDGKWMMSGADNPMFRESISYANNPIAVKEIVVNYNDSNPLNDYKVNGEEQNRNAVTEISYEIKTENTNIVEQIEKEQMKNASTRKRILIGIPTNKYIEPETMKAIYDLEVPEGYTTEFQFFYGYQIDQIRNLIAEWAKHYDYLFSVDSDIVMPKDTLTKMISADKDIISGLYIQRIPNTHTLEIYKDHLGGCINIPYEEVEGRGVFEIAACGMGCALIKGEVFRKLEYPHFYYQSAINHRNTISEDVYFCKKTRDNGFTIWADETIRCDHIGQTTYRVQEPSMKTETKTHLEKISEQDLLPRDHVNYIKSLDIEPKVIYDIGACVLHWTRHAKSKWPNAEYYLIDAADSVEQFLDKSGDSWAIEVLSNEDGKEITFYEDSENPGGNSYYIETTGAFTEQHAKTKKTITLDTLVSEENWSKPDLIKMDVQGAEIDILKGATETIKHCNNIILEAQHVDYNQGAPKVDAVIEYMNSIGFELVSNFCKGAADGDYHFRRMKS